MSWSIMLGLPTRFEISVATVFVHFDRCIVVICIRESLPVLLLRSSLIL